MATTGKSGLSLFTDQRARLDDTSATVTNATMRIGLTGGDEKVSPRCEVVFGWRKVRYGGFNYCQVRCIYPSESRRCMMTTKEIKMYLFSRVKEASGLLHQRA